MAAASATRGAAPHPVQLVLLVSALPLFLGALLADWAYSATYVVQWTHFASWLIVGGLLFAGLSLPGALIGAVRRGGRAWLHFALLLATFLLGLLNALVHAMDAWAAMPEAFILSGVVLLLMLATIWTAFAAGAPR